MGQGAGAAMTASERAKINFQTAGTGDPTLIFVHGFGCALSDWDRQIEALSPKFCCVALDLPGHGGSAKSQDATIEAMARAVNEVKARIGTKKAILIGHSMGCRVVLEALIQSRAGVAGLVFVDGSILGGDPKAGVSKAKQAVSSAGVDAFSQRLFDDMFVPGADSEMKERIIARALGVDPGLREELFLDMVRWDLAKSRDGLKQLAVPVLVLQSTFFNAELKRMPMQAGMTTPWMDAVAQLAAKSSARVISGIGHFTMIDAAAETAAEIENFVVSV